MQPELLFNKDGDVVNDQAATFTSLPHSALLTLIMDTPQSWLIEAVGSNQDLDNINLGEVNNYVNYVRVHVFLQDLWFWFMVR